MTPYGARLMVGNLRTAGVIPVLFLGGKRYPGDIPDSFSKDMFSIPPFFGKPSFIEGFHRVSVPVTSCNWLVFDCDIMHPPARFFSNRRDQHWIFDHTGAPSGKFQCKSTPNQSSQVYISK